MASFLGMGHAILLSVLSAIVVMDVRGILILIRCRLRIARASILITIKVDTEPEISQNVVSLDSLIPKRNQSSESIPNEALTACKCPVNVRHRNLLDRWRRDLRETLVHLC